MNQQFLTNQQDSSLKMLPTNLNFQYISQLLTKGQFTQEHMNLFFGQGTHLNFQEGNPTCKKRDAKESGTLAFSFTASSNDTLYQFLTSKKKTFQMAHIQNLYNNFCNNIHAGVLFTMNGTKDNTDLLANDSTIPTQPNLYLNKNSHMIGRPDNIYQNPNFSLSKIGLSTDESGRKIISQHRF
mmetsp:Transcript_44010/g.42592  ORF Transcript_44010/g.42592 Transcript_44010/m.42592 type:complete len:183 (-) Transcript_44010:626-1174(-)